MLSSVANVHKSLRRLGFVLVLFGAIILLDLYSPIVKEEFRFARLAPNAQVSNPFTSCPDAVFTISIPRLGTCTRVIPEVNPLDSRIYQVALTEGVAHAQGTGLPGEGRNIFLFAHSSGNPLDAARFNSVFYLLYKLEPGDHIYLRYHKQEFNYQVSTLNKVAPSEVSYLTQSTTPETLTLMTCWPPGTTLKRLLVVAKPIGL